MSRSKIHRPAFIDGSVAERLIDFKFMGVRISEISLGCNKLMESQRNLINISVEQVEE